MIITLLKPKIIPVILIAVLLIVIVSAGLFYFCPKFFKNNSKASVKISDHKFSVEIADEPSEKSRGLSGREKLCDDCGMIFLFDKPSRYGFWMKGMEFPLDFIWIAGDKIIDIDKNISPDYLGILKPKIPVDKILEVNAGVCDKYKIETGNEIKINLGLRKKRGNKGIKIGD